MIQTITYLMVDQELIYFIWLRMASIETVLTIMCIFLGPHESFYDVHGRKFHFYFPHNDGWNDVCKAYSCIV